MVIDEALIQQVIGAPYPAALYRQRGGRFREVPVERRDSAAVSIASPPGSEQHQ